MKHPLIHPLEVGKKRITELEFREDPTAEDLLAFDEVGGHRATIQLIANLAGTDFEIAKRLHVDDYRACDIIVTNLIKPHKTEKNSPES